MRWLWFEFFLFDRFNGSMLMFKPLLTTLTVGMLILSTHIQAQTYYYDDADQRLRELQEQARETGLPFIFYMYQDDCDACEETEKALNHPDIAPYFRDGKCLMAKVNRSQIPRGLSGYNEILYPLILVGDETGKVILQKGGVQSPEMLADLLSQIAQPPVPPAYVVQVGSFEERESAIQVFDRVKNLYQNQRVMMEPATVDGVKYYRVIMGPFLEEVHADVLLSDYERNTGREGFVRNMNE